MLVPCGAGLVAERLERSGFWTPFSRDVAFQSFFVAR